jgi:dTDP-glucose 4,6-dehydratase
VRYVISGAAGFIGSHICDQLIEKGHDVLAIDNLITGHKENIGHLLSHPNFEFIEHDICTPIEIPRSVDRVFHLASLASPVDYLAKPIETLESGSTGTRMMLEIARRDNARFLLTSGASANRNLLGQCESSWIAILLRRE